MLQENLFHQHMFHFYFSILEIFGGYPVFLSVTFVFLFHKSHYIYPAYPTPIIDSTFSLSGRPRTILTKFSALVLSSCILLRICTQQEPNPIDTAVSCAMIEAIEQSSTHTSDFSGSPQITIHKRAPFKNSEPLFLLNESSRAISGEVEK